MLKKSNFRPYKRQECEGIAAYKSASAGAMIIEQAQGLGKKLLETGLLTPDELSKAIRAAEGHGSSLSKYIVEAGLVPKMRAYEILADVYGVPFVDLSSFRIEREVISLVPSELAHRYKVMPLFKIANSLNIAMENPLDASAADHLARATSLNIDVCLSAPEDIELALQAHYGVSSSMSQLLETLHQERTHRYKGDSQKSRLRLVLKSDGSKDMGHPVIQLVDLMLQQAVEEGASDIHVEPEEKTMRIRYRVDGVLHEVSSPPKDMESEIISRIKILAQMDISENRLPQDGRIKATIDSNEIDMRVSCIPTIYGENVVIRILRDQQAVLDLSSLGFSSEAKKIFERLIQRPFGMILETGPTGSGKTTTLYAALKLINSMDRNIVTIEDPVEYKLPLLRQTQVNNKAGFTFANALRSILRQDPDVIMVGEIRDKETAEIAVQAALTGHLVFSTLHTRNAAGVVTRLMDMKIDPFLVASSVIGVVAQRLLRRICSKCKEEEKLSEGLLEMLKVKAGGLRTYKGKGCLHCHHTGYKGRVGVFEILPVDERIQTKIIAHASIPEIEHEAKQSGFKSLLDDALEKVDAGMTTVEEVIKYVDLG